MTPVNAAWIAVIGNVTTKALPVAAPPLDLMGSPTTAT